MILSRRASPSIAGFINEKCAVEAALRSNYLERASTDGCSVRDGGVETPRIIPEAVKKDGTLDEEAIRAVIYAHPGQIRWCYEKELTGNADFVGKIVVHFEIIAAGSACSSEVLSAALDNVAVKECVLDRVSTWDFPVSGGAAKVNYPFAFAQDAARRRDGG